MAKKVYALLVGIDHYAPTSVLPIPSLRGCVNDINAIRDYLQERIANNKESEYDLLENRILINETATRQAVIDGFQQHLCNADSDDVVLFYYAGHGSQEPAPEEFWHLEPDHLNETLVCYDSRTINSRDITDKELGHLIFQVARNNPHIVIILDCCHSGSGTRDIPQGVRRAPLETRERPWSSFLFSSEISSSRSLEESVSLLEGKHVILSACRDYQEAKEYRGENGQPRGVFSYFLLQVLQRTNGNLTYRELGQIVNGLVSGKVTDQFPQVEATHPQELLNQAFLGGAVPDRPAHFTLSYNNHFQSWVINGGTLHGIPKTSGGEETVLAIFPGGSGTEQLRQDEEALGEASVTQVLPQRSLVKINRGEEILSVDESYWAIIICLPLTPVKIELKGEESEKLGLELAHKALQTANFGQPSLYVAQVDPSQPKQTDFTLVARQGQYWIVRPVDEQALVTTHS